MPRRCSRRRKGSLSKALSAMMRSGHCRGRPRGRGTLTWASVASANVTSCGDADAKRTPTGIPLPSARTIHFVPLPRLVFPTARPLFLPAKLPSKQVSCQRSRPRRSSCDSKVRHISSSAPGSSHPCKRRQQVDPLGYCDGISRHRAPVRNTHKTPAKHARLSAQGRPRPSPRRWSFGKSGSNFFHCLSVIITHSRNHNPLPS
jgi:hypothetical protein